MAVSGLSPSQSTRSDPSRSLRRSTVDQLSMALRASRSVSSFGGRKLMGSVLPRATARGRLGRRLFDSERVRSLHRRKQARQTSASNWSSLKSSVQSTHPASSPRNPRRDQSSRSFQSRLSSCRFGNHRSRRSAWGTSTAEGRFVSDASVADGISKVLRWFEEKVRLLRFGKERSRSRICRQREDQLVTSSSKRKPERTEVRDSSVAVRLSSLSLPKEGNCSGGGGGARMRFKLCKSGSTEDKCVSRLQEGEGGSVTELVLTSDQDLRAPRAAE
jgi:hypothetical protein